MRVTHWFIGTVTRPQPGVKIDYAAYLRADAAARASMHATGAVVTKLVPFLALPPALAVVVLGIGQIVTDALWSTKSSGWKQIRREMRYR